MMLQILAPPAIVVATPNASTPGDMLRYEEGDGFDTPPFRWSGVGSGLLVPELERRGGSGSTPSATACRRRGGAPKRRGEPARRLKGGGLRL
jgi:hypothetical protein